MTLSQEMRCFFVELRYSAQMGMSLYSPLFEEKCRAVATGLWSALDMWSSQEADKQLMITEFWKRVVEEHHPQSGSRIHSNVYLNTRACEMYTLLRVTGHGEFEQVAFLQTSARLACRHLEAALTRMLSDDNQRQLLLTANSPDARRANLRLVSSR